VDVLLWIGSLSAIATLIAFVFGNVLDKLLIRSGLADKLLIRVGLILVSAICIGLYLSRAHVPEANELHQRLVQEGKEQEARSANFTLMSNILIKLDDIRTMLVGGAPIKQVQAELASIPAAIKHAREAATTQDEKAMLLLLESQVKQLQLLAQQTPRPIAPPAAVVRDPNAQPANVPPTGAAGQNAGGGGISPTLQVLSPSTGSTAATSTPPQKQGPVDEKRKGSPQPPTGVTATYH
jgi:hypothetical protein